MRTTLSRNCGRASRQPTEAVQLKNKRLGLRKEWVARKTHDGFVVVVISKHIGRENANRALRQYLPVSGSTGTHQLVN